MLKTDTTEDRVLWRSELENTLNVSSETIRRWLRNGNLPAPDVDMTRRSRGWKLSTLRAAGINLP